jgi:hypothetical protein
MFLVDCQLWKTEETPLRGHERPVEAASVKKQIRAFDKVKEKGIL